MTRCVLVLALALVASSATSDAQPAGAQAEVLFREGRKLMAAGKLAEACAMFEQSQKLEAATTTLLNLAGCREQNGQLATAWGLFLDAERQTRAAGDAATQKLHDIALARAQRLEPRVSKLTISVLENRKLDGLEIVRGTDRVDAVMWNRAMPIDGGTYTITARAPGAAAWSAHVTVAPEGDTKTVDVPDLRGLARDLGATKPDPPPAVAVTATVEPLTKQDETPASPAGHRSKLVPLALGAGGVALLGGALGFSLWGNSTYDKAKAELTDQARRDSLYSSANTKRYAAEGLAVAGVGCVGIAVWLYLSGRSQDASGTVVAPMAGADRVGVAITGSY